MGIFPGSEIASKVLSQEETLIYVAGASPFAKSISKAFDDEDNEILGFIPNPGNTVATVFGVPIGTQFGTAAGMEGWGALFVDIITDPTTWLSVGAIAVPEPTTTAAGVAGLSATLAKHGLTLSQFGVKASKLQKAQKFLGGRSVATKTQSMADIFQTAAKAVENPKLVQEIVTASQAGDTARMFKGVDALKAKSLNNRFYKMGPNTVIDIKKLEATSGLEKLREAYQVEQQLKLASEGLFSFNDEAISALRYGFTGPKFMSKGIDMLNTLPGVEAVARGTNVVTSGVGEALNRGFKLTGLDATKEALFNSYYKHTAIVGAAKALGQSTEFIKPRIQFEGNASIIKLVENNHIAKARVGLHNWTDRAYMSMLDAVSATGEAGRILSDNLGRLRTHAEYKAGGAISQLWKVGGRKSGIKNTLEDHITNKLSGQQKLDALDSLSIMKQDETFADQTMVLETMLQTDGVAPGEVWRYLKGGDLADTPRALLIRGVSEKEALELGISPIAPRLPGANRFLRYKGDGRFIPSAETKEAFKVMQNNAEVFGKTMEQIQLPRFQVTREMSEMTGEQIRALEAQDTFKMVKSERGRGMFSPHTGLANEKRIDMINTEIARQQAYDELAEDIIAGRKTWHDAEKLADDLIKNKDPKYIVARDDAYRLHKAESNITLNSSANFSRNELGIVGYSADAGGRNFKAPEFYDKWAGYFAGASQSIMNHVGITNVVRRAPLSEYVEILKRQGVSESDISRIIVEKKENMRRFLKGQGIDERSIERIIQSKIDKDELTFSVTQADELIDAMVRETGDIKAGAMGRNLVDKFLGNHVKRDTLSWQLVTQANKYQIATKLTAVMSALTNLGQIANVLVDSGHHAFFAAAKKSADDLVKGAPGVADEIGTLAHNSVKDLDEGLNAFGGTIDTILEVYGFSTVERFNRRMSTYAGILTAESMEKAVGVRSAKEGWESFWGRYGKTTDKMAKSYADPKAIRAQLNKAKLPKTAKEAQILNSSLPSPDNPALTQFVKDNRIRSVDEIMDAIKNGNFTGFNKAEVKQIATETVNLQQFRTSAVDVAEAFNNPLGSFVGIFMKFQFKQSEFFIKRVAKPGLEWIKSGGKEGNIAPLLLSLSPIGALAIGEVIMDIKASLNDRQRTDHIAERLWEDYLAIGGAGFFTSVIEPFATGTFNPFKAKQLAGANVNDLVKFTEAIGIALTEGEDDKFYDELMKDLTHPLPARLRDIPRSALRGLKQDKESRQTQLEFDRFLDERAQDQAEQDLFVP